MTKAERIFEETYAGCRDHIKKWGYEENTGFQRMFYKDNETFSKRTANAVQKLIDKEKRNLELDKELHVLSPDRICFLEQSLKMVQATLNNTLII